MNWSDVSDELKEEFIENDGKVPEDDYVGSYTVEIAKLDPTTKEVLKVYKTMGDVVAKYHMANRTLKSAISADIELRGYRWRYA